MSLLVLGIDPSQRCGWAFVLHHTAGHVLPDGTVVPAKIDRVASGTWILRASTSEPEGLRFVRFGRYLRDAVDRYGCPGLAAVEKPGLVRTDAVALSLWGTYSHAMAWAADEGVPFVAVPIATIKARAGATRATGKAATVAWAARRYRFQPEGDDEADAVIAATVAPRLAGPGIVF